MVGGALVVLHVLLALLGPLLAPFDPAQYGVGPPQSPASLVHPFGTDSLGRDVFSRVLHAAPVVLTLSILGTFLGVSIGAALGLFSAYVGGATDEVLQRLFEALISIPFIMLALLTIAAAGPENAGQPWLLCLAIAVVYLPRVGRIARAAALELITRDFVLAARLRGEGAWSVVRRELLPNASGVLLVEFALRAGYAPVLIGALGFLGLGLKPSIPEWGQMMSENRALFLVTPMATVGPAAVLATLVVGLNLLTDGLSRLYGRATNREV
jgi:peptide/nickel transport system permease protein